ncbi:MAG: hypothetical protein ABJE47_09170 [bacterium]
MLESGARTNAAVAEWAELSEKLIRGLVHALNNRITALSSFSQLIAMGDQVTSQQVLPGELAALSSVSDHLRALCSERLGTEALEIVPVLAEAVTLHRHHPVLRAIRCDVSMLSSLQPIRVPRWALLRLLLVMIDGSKRSADAAGRDTLPIGVQSTEQTLSVFFYSDGVRSNYAEEMAALCGASIDLAGDRQVVTFPTLLEIRRRERAARETANS